VHGLSIGYKGGIGRQEQWRKHRMNIKAKMLRKGRRRIQWRIHPEL
jgi:hypothetical protein